MKKWLSFNRAEEYLIISALVGFVIILGVVSTFVEDDFDFIFYGTCSLLVLLYFSGRINLDYFFYTLCMGVSFLPYVNLQIFPVSGVYIVAVIFIFFSFISFIKHKENIKIPPQAKWMSLFLALGIFSILVAPDKKAVIIYGGQFFLYICVYVATVNILDKKTKIVRALKYIIYGGAITFFISLVQFVISLASLQRVVDIFYNSILGKLFIGERGLERVGNDAVEILNRGTNIAESSNFVLFRVFGTFEGPTIFGWYLLIISLLLAGLYIVQIKKTRIGFKQHSYAFLFLCSAIFLSLTWTRSALLAFLLAFIFILVYRNKDKIRIITAKRVKILSSIIVILLAFAGMFWLLEIPVPAQIFTNIFDVNKLGGSTIGRLLTMLFALTYIAQHPLVGIGFGNYKYVQPGININTGEASFATAHNTYLELGVELGLPGLIIFLFILHSFIKQAAVLVKARIGSFYHTLGITFMAIWLGFAFVSLFGGNLIHPRFMTLLWILAGIQTASYHLYLNDKKKEHTIYRLQAAD